MAKRKSSGTRLIGIRRPASSQLWPPSPGGGDLLQIELPTTDNSPGALDALLRANGLLRQSPWPEPYRTTSHVVREGDARDLSWLSDGSVQLVVTSPPYWVLKKYNNHPDQLGDVSDYEEFLAELEKVWRDCLRVLVPGGRVCCVVGDVCL